MSDTLVTVASYDNPMDAQILRGRLEAEGLSARVTDAETVSMAWHLSQAVGGVKVQVAPRDAERARELLEQLDVAAKAEPGVLDPAEQQELRANRALLAAFLGIIFPPLQGYSIWLIIRLFGGGRPLPGRVKWQIFLALLLDVWLLAAAFIALRFIGFWSA